MSALLTLFLVLVLAYIAAEIATALGLPRVVGQLLSGVLLGTHLLNLGFFGTESISLLSTLADVGVVLLFFFVGLEINLSGFKKSIKQSLSISLLNTVIPFAVGFAAARYFGLSDVVSLIVGISLSVSSQAVALDILDERGWLRTRIGQTIIAAGAVDDVVEFVFISLVLTAVHFSVGTTLAAAATQIIAFLATLAVFRFFILPPLMRLFEKEERKSTIFAGALIVTLFFAIIGDFFGLGTLLGALAAGVMLRHILLTETPRPWEEHKLAHEVHAISFGFLVPIFFFWVGFNTNISSIFSAPLMSAAFLAIALIGTVGGTLIAVKLFKRSTWEAFIVGLGVTAKGDVELAIAALALKNGLISNDVFSALIFMAIGTTIIAPILFKKFAVDYLGSVQPKPFNSRGK